jgi:hypothetical protein
MLGVGTTKRGKDVTPRSTAKLLDQNAWPP